eukprot:XP_011670879.1 PREDICTED: uncharacterized protein LOC105441461 [Strongylocentrotus purpuratus]
MARRTSRYQRSTLQPVHNPIHILQADKGNATVLLNKGDYNKIGALLETLTYKQLKKDPTLTTERKLTSDSSLFTEQNSYPRHSISNSFFSPILFGQLKIHKPTIPLCPIISTRGLPCYDTAKYLTLSLQPLVGQSQHHINNSKHFVDILSKTTIHDTESCRIVKERLEADDTLPDRTPVTRDEIHDLMYFCLNSTSFKWRDNYYQQLQGAVMGSPLSPVIANIFMEHFKTTALQLSLSTPFSLAPICQRHIRHLAA